jgi:lysophospholipase L1-like esterase
MLGRLSPIRLVVLSCVFSLVLAEVVLRLLGTQLTFVEENGNGYQSSFGITSDSHYCIYEPYLNHRHTNQDFSFAISANKHGFVGSTPTEKKTRFRIAVLGDSFTEGVGALSPDSSYPALLEGILATQYPNLNAEVLNFGVGGSDVVFETRYLIDSMAQFAPDLVLMTYNNSDLTDIIQWGGVERFHTDGTTHARQLPWWSWFFQHLHLVRILVSNGLGYDEELLMHSETVTKEFAHAEDVIIESVVEADTYSKQIGAKFMVVLMPFANDLVSEKKKKEQTFSRLEARINSKNIACTNLFYPMSQVINESSLPQYSWWKYDGHYKHTGYLLVAQRVASSPELKAALVAQ